jgi:putative endonuclease
MFTVYAIKSEVKNYIYVGLTKDIDDRIRRHNSGYERTTRSYKPFKLIYTETYSERIKAREREKYLKSGVGKEFLKKLIQ